MANVFYYDIDKIKSYYIDPKKDFFVVQKNLIYVIPLHYFFQKFVFDISLL